MMSLSVSFFLEEKLRHYEVWGIWAVIFSFAPMQET